VFENVTGRDPSVWLHATQRKTGQNINSEAKGICPHFTLHYTVTAILPGDDPHKRPKHVAEDK
jgi:hypothetical protein